MLSPIKRTILDFIYLQTGTDGQSQLAQPHMVVTVEWLLRSVGILGSQGIYIGMFCFVKKNAKVSNETIVSFSVNHNKYNASLVQLWSGLLVGITVMTSSPLPIPFALRKILLRNVK